MECSHRGQSNSGSEHVFPNHRFTSGGFFDAVRAAPATAASFEIVEHSAFRSSLFGIGSGGDNEYCRLRFLGRDFSCEVRLAASIQSFGRALCNLTESNGWLG